MIWGSGKGAVAEAPGYDSLELRGSSEGPVVQSDRLGRIWIMPVGDPGISETAAYFRVEGCDYTVWVHTDQPLSAIEDYFAHRY